MSKSYLAPNPTREQVAAVLRAAERLRTLVLTSTRSNPQLLSRLEARARLVQAVSDCGYGPELGFAARSSAADDIDALAEVPVIAFPGGEPWEVVHGAVWAAWRLCHDPEPKTDAADELERIILALGSHLGAQAPADVEPDQWVTLDQAAAMVGRSKKTLERRLNTPKTGEEPMPAPDVDGGGGKAHEWRWAKLRPWLERHYGKRLPERFPSNRH